jgi:Kdo2-lipid IVA lauroyltransferase/acyltransferase
VEKLKGALLVGASARVCPAARGARCNAVGSAIGWLMWKTCPTAPATVVRINLAKCFPDMDPAARERLAGQSLKDIGKSP